MAVIVILNGILLFQNDSPRYNDPTMLTSGASASKDPPQEAGKGRQPTVMDIGAARWGWILIPSLLLAGFTAWIYFADCNAFYFFLANRSLQFMGDRFWSLVTLWGNGLFAFAVLTLFFRRKPRLVWAFVFATLLFLIFGHGLKNLLAVARPPAVIPADRFHLIGPAWKTNAFPSGHSAMAFILAGSFFLTVRRFWGRIILIGLASLVALSRVVVGVHWPLDVAAGSLLGWWLAWIGIALVERWRWCEAFAARKVLGVFLVLASVLLLCFHDTGYTLLLTVQRVFGGILLTVGLYELLALFGIELAGKLRADSGYSDHGRD